MANLKVSSQELDNILGELEGELNGILADTQNRLAKAREEDGSPSPGMGSASAAGGSPSAGGPPSAGGEAPPMGAEGGDPSAGGEAPPMGAEGGDPSAGGEAPPPGMEGGAPGQEGGGAPLDPAALEQEYAQLPPEELKAHYLAAKAALMQVMGGGQGAGPSAPVGPPGAGAGGPPPAASPSPQGAPPMAMGEGKNIGVSQAGNGGQFGKSEIADLHAQIEALTKIVTTVVNRPMQKAITGTSYVAKSEEAPKKPVSPSEITAKLHELTRSPELKKSDRDLITGFYEKRVNLAAIEHLLK